MDGGMKERREVGVDERKDDRGQRRREERRMENGRKGMDGERERGREG